MKRVTLATAVALGASATVASAGGLDRSGQGIGVIFEKGNYAELTYGYAMPSVEGIGPNSTLTGLAPTGNVGLSYGTLGMAVKTDVNEKLSLAMIMDEPFGASVAYTTPGYVISGSNTSVNSTGLTALARYKFNESFSVHGGLRYVSVTGHYDASPAPGPTPPFPAGTLVDYGATYGSDSDLGYVVGIAYEKPEIALRAALTYSSGTSFTLPGTAIGNTVPLTVGLPAGTVTAKMPQSVNLDVQTGIAKNTLLFGSLRWADWDAAHITDSVAGSLVAPKHDTYTYSLGIGRKFSESFSGAVTLGYETAKGGTSSNLSPTDGYFSIGLGGTYTHENMKITGGVRYVKVGDAITERTGASFKGNSALGVGVKVAFSF